jgi:hypothetical protein
VESGRSYGDPQPGSDLSVRPCLEQEMINLSFAIRQLEIAFEEMIAYPLGFHTIPPPWLAL